MITFTFWLLLASLLLPPAQADRLGKDVLHDNLWFLDAHDEFKPPHPGFTVESWVGGYYPQACEHFAQEVKNKDTDLRPHCDLDQVEVFNITYSDCPDQSWVLCRCLDAELDMLGLARGVGRLAPGLRAGISHAMAVSKKQIDGTDGGIFGANSGGRVILQGDTPDRYIAHEAFHSMDNKFHNSAAFNDSLEADTCVPNGYSNSAAQEDFAEMGTYLHYDLNGWPIENWVKKDTSCMKNQLRTVKAEVKGYVDLQTSQCASRGPDDKFVDPLKKGKGNTKVSSYPASPGISRISQNFEAVDWSRMPDSVSDSWRCGTAI